MASAQIITVSGLPGSGTSTVCGHLCTRLGWSYVDAGQIFRRLALESGLNLAEFGQRAEADGRIDRQLDERMVARAQAEVPIVLEGRLTGWMAYRHDLTAFKVWLAAAPEIRSQRVGNREAKPAARALKEMQAREASEARRYLEHHDIPFGDLSIYDLVVDSESLDACAVVDQIVDCLEV